MNPPIPSEPYRPSTASEPTTRRPSGPMVIGSTADVDAELVRRMRTSDQQALGAFYDRWFPVVSSLASRMLKAQDEIEDVVEETFWQVWRQAARFEAERGSVRTWVLTMARSRALDYLRAARRHREESGDHRKLEEASGAGLLDASSSNDALQDAEHAERRRIVRAALSELPAEQREALELGYFGGFSQSEIAQRTGQPLGTVKTRMRLAIRKLRTRLMALHEGAR